MWDQYKRTFVRMQFTIFAVSLAVYLALGHLWVRATVFFVAMQISAVIGAVWAARLKSLVQRWRTSLPLPPCD